MRATRSTTIGLAFLLLPLAGLTASAQNDADTEAGAEVYQQHCASCHGDNLRSAGVVPDLRDIGADERPRFDKAVLEGRGQMPAWQGVISPQEIDQLWAYLRANGR